MASAMVNRRLHPARMMVIDEEVESAQELFGWLS